MREQPAAASRKDVNVDHVPPHLAPTQDQAKHWMKAHRTMIASSTSSVLSTLSAVGRTSAMNLRQFALMSVSVSLRFR